MGGYLLPHLSDCKDKTHGDTDTGSGDVEGPFLRTFHIKSYGIRTGSIIVAVLVLALVFWLA